LQPAQPSVDVCTGHRANVARESFREFAESPAQALQIPLAQAVRLVRRQQLIHDLPQPLGSIFIGCRFT
jgi:hypothetical protein